MQSVVNISDNLIVYRVDYEHSVATVRAQLGEKAFAAAWTEGRTMMPEQALTAQTPVMKPSSEEPSSTPPTKSTPTYPDGLTTREVEVLRLVAQGLTNEQVAEQLVISPRTDNTHLTSIYGKIDVSSRSAATTRILDLPLIVRTKVRYDRFLHVSWVSLIKVVVNPVPVCIQLS